MGHYNRRRKVLTWGAVWVATLAILATGVSAEILPGSILPNGDAETEQLPSFPGWPDNWFASTTYDATGAISQFCVANGLGPCTGAFWDSDNVVSGTHSFGLIDSGLPGDFAHSEWRTFAAPMPVGTAFLHWQWDALYEVLGGFDPRFQVNMRVGGPFIGTGNLAGALDWQLFLEGNSGGQFVTMTGDVPVVAGLDESFDIIFRTRGDGSTLGEMFLDDVSVVPIANFSDFDASLQVDGSDFLAWQRGGGLSAPIDVGITAIKSLGDSNGDLTVDAADLAIWEQEYGNVQSLSSTQSVPEPTTGLLGLVAGLAMGFIGRQQGRQ